MDRLTITGTAAPILTQLKVRPEDLVDRLMSAFKDQIQVADKAFIDDECRWVIHRPSRYHSNEVYIIRLSTREEHVIMDGLKALRGHLVRGPINNGV